MTMQDYKALIDEYKEALAEYSSYPEGDWEAGADAVDRLSRAAEALERIGIKASKLPL